MCTIMLGCHMCSSPWWLLLIRYFHGFGVVLLSASLFWGGEVLLSSPPSSHLSSLVWSGAAFLSSFFGVVLHFFLLLLRGAALSVLVLGGVAFLPCFFGWCCFRPLLLWNGAASLCLLWVMLFARLLPFRIVLTSSTLKGKVHCYFNGTRTICQIRTPTFNAHSVFLRSRARIECSFLGVSLKSSCASSYSSTTRDIGRASCTRASHNEVHTKTRNILHPDERKNLNSRFWLKRRSRHFCRF